MVVLPWPGRAAQRVIAAHLTAGSPSNERVRVPRVGLMWPGARRDGPTDKRPAPFRRSPGTSFCAILQGRLFSPRRVLQATKNTIDERETATTRAIMKGREKKGTQHSV